MAASDICGQPVSKCRTIDHTREKALLNARKAFPGSKLHTETAVAVDNLLNCLGGTPERVMIVGHGKRGLIITGTGKFDTNEDCTIKMLPFDELQGQGALELLKDEITELTFCSCDTAAEDEGATLLETVANVVGATVSGFTRQIFIDKDGNITCEEGGVWQHAEPAKVLPRIKLPEYPIEDNIVLLKLKDQDHFITLPISAVSELRYFEPEQQEKTKKRKKKPLFSLQGDKAQELVGSVHFDKPKEIKGAPLAVHTATLEIDVRINHSTKVWRFIVYNDRLLQDEAATDTFYFASSEFIKRVREHLKPPQGEWKPPQRERERKPPHNKKR